MTDPRWDPVVLSATYSVALDSPIVAQSWRGKTYFIRSLVITVQWEDGNDFVRASYKGRGVFAKADGTPGGRVTEVHKYVLASEPGEVVALVEEAKRRARRHR